MRNFDAANSRGESRTAVYNRGVRRKTMLLILLFGALPQFPAAALGQRSSIGEYRVIPQSLAPAEILRQLTLLKQQRVYIPGDPPADALDKYVTQLWQSLHLPDNWKGRCGCNALMSEEEGFARYVTLRIGNGGWDYRFMVFLSPVDSKDSWRLLGYADTESKYAVPSYRVVSDRGGMFVVVSEDSGGTGAFRSYEVWHEMRPGGSQQVLRYPTEGHDDPFFGGTVDGKSYSLAREWQAASHLPNEKDLSVVVDLTVRYSVYLDDTESLLFERKQKAVFQWDATSHTYKLDTKDSSLTQQELDAVYDYDTLSLRKFIQYNTQELRKSSNPFALELLRQAP